MKITHVKSAAVIIEDNGVKVLCDPWLVDGEYYGSWYHYPPPDVQPEDFNDVDFIYVTHIHPDHMSKKTMARMRKDIPVLIHRYEEKFLKMNLEKLGFTDVRELPHNERTPLKGNLHINILAADNCNPELCGKFFGCAIVEAKYGSTQIDSLGVFDNGEQVVVNVNDCPFALAKEASAEVLRQYGKVDFLLTGYGGAGEYPQCFRFADPEEQRKAAKRKRLQFLQQGEDFIHLFQPTYYMPFAGTYVLAGKYASYNATYGVPEIEDAKAYFDASEKIHHAHSHCILLNSLAWFDLDTGTSSQPYVPIDREAKRRYIAEVLSKKQMDYEADPMPSADELAALIPAAFQRLDKKRQELEFSTDTDVFLSLGSGRGCKLSFNGGGYQFMDEDAMRRSPKYVLLTVDPRLLKLILSGPRFAHWNNASIGSHVQFERHPDQYERALYHCLSFFHA